MLQMLPPQSSAQKEPGILRPSQAMTIEPPQWPLATLESFFQTVFPMFTAGQRSQVGTEKKGKGRSRRFQKTGRSEDTAALSKGEACTDALRTWALENPRPIWSLETCRSF